ncbi:MAG: AarF/UbiB family protein, partial [Candidatus Micrarchaeota archaeon]
MVDQIRRLEEITRILARHGFVEIIELLRGSSNATVRRFVSEFFPRTPKEPLGVRLRMALEELGPTFIKFGQLLSSRSDMLPRDILEEMEKLQDDVPPFPFEQVQEILEREFGGRKIFSSIEKKPLAAASIGQVH